MFFLIDDAFRVGEYVEVGGTKGTVEAISVRSMRLRHQRGAVHTIPFGEIKTLTNYMRDWVILKMEFRVPFDADIDKIRKIVKQVGVGLAEDPEMGPKFLAPLKSQGVHRIEDEALVIRTKFTCRPGDQFLIRREAFRLIMEAFGANGVDLAVRRVRVQSSGGDDAAGAAAGSIATAKADAGADAP